MKWLLLTLIPVSFLKLLTAKEKLKFEDLAKSDKVRYEREMKTYVPPKGMGKPGKRKKDPNAPKRPPYVLNTHTMIGFDSYGTVILIFNLCLWSRKVCVFRLLRGSPPKNQGGASRHLHWRHC